jgi:hypothetical protein
MNKLKGRLRLLGIRLTVAFQVIFKPKQSFIHVVIDKEDLKKLVEAEFFSDKKDFSNVGVWLTTHRLQDFVALKIIEIAASKIDPDEMVLKKAMMQIAADEYESANK